LHQAYGRGVDFRPSAAAPDAAAVCIPYSNKLVTEINAILKSPDVAEKIASQGGDVIGGKPEAFAAFLKTDTARRVKPIKDANIKPE
jgi:tripartite-type tricarboxylate transporter receptor subunit TctC